MGKKLSRLGLVVILALCNVLPVLASDEVVVTTTTPVILASRGMHHARIIIRVKNHRDNRWIKLQWDEGCSTERQLNNPTMRAMESGEFERSLHKKEYLQFTDESLVQNVSRTTPAGLWLPPGEYEIVVTLTRTVEGKDKEFISKVRVNIGVKDEEIGW